MRKVQESILVSFCVSWRRSCLYPRFTVLVHAVRIRLGEAVGRGFPVSLHATYSLLGSIEYNLARHRSYCSAGKILDTKQAITV